MRHALQIEIELTTATEQSQRSQLQLELWRGSCRVVCVEVMSIE
jgi:hypothetical protein